MWLSSEAEYEKRPTTRTIAIQAGVSNATVSMALRNHPLISVKTRERVQRVAEQLGYRPDPEVAKLMYHLRLKHKPKYKSTIAAITTLAEDAEPPYASALRHGAEGAAEARGYGFNVYRVSPSEVRNGSVQRMLRNRGVEAVLLLPMREPTMLTDFLDWSRFSSVAATYSVLAPDFQRVVPDQFGNTLLICKQLARLKCRRIGLVIDAQTDLVVDHRFSAAVMWQNTMGGTEHVAPLISEGSYRNGLRPWFASERPDAIIAGTELQARTIAKDLDIGLTRPVRFALTERPGATRFGGINQRPSDIGAAAVAMLHAKIQSGEKGIPKVPSITMLKGIWVQPKPSGSTR